MKIQHSPTKKLTALLLSVVVVLTVLPTGTIAIAADERKILSFEKSNPVASVSGVTGSSISQSQFPDELTAVVADAPQSFMQQKPETSGEYSAPDYADDLYAAGGLVVYSFPGASGTEYRVYGEADGAAGWFACDESGVIYGRIQSVPVSWDISAVNTGIAGTYTVTGNVGGYALACPAPEASVSILAKSGDENIALHTLTWISGNPDGTDLSLTPERNVKTRAAYQLDFSKGGDEEIPAGQIEIRLPAHIFFGRDGQPIDTAVVPLAQAPDETGDTGFNYTIDEKTGEIVIRNYKTIDSSYHFTCQIGYDFIPYQVADGYSNSNIQASFLVKDSSGDLKTESETLSVDVHTSTKDPTVQKSVSSKYENWQSEWGPAPADAADYFYVEWRIETSRYRGTQPYTLTFQENVGAYGTFVGWREGSGSYTLGSEAEYENKVFYNSSVTALNEKDENSLTHYVLVKYPRTMLETTTEVENTCTAHVNGLDGDNRTGTGSRTYTYLPPELAYPGDRCLAGKIGGGEVRGGLNLLENGMSAGTSFTITTSVQGYGMTHDGADPYTTVLDDGLMGISGKKLEPEDYSFTAFSVSSLSEYGFRIDPEKGYQPVLNSDYASYQPITVFVRTIDSPNQWTELGTVTRQAGNRYLWVGADGTSQNVSSSSKVALPEGTYDVRFTHTGITYQVSFSISLSYKLHPTEHVMQLIKGKSSFDLRNVDSSYAMDKDGVIGTTGIGGGGDLSAAVRAADTERYGQAVSHAYAQNTYSKLKPTSSYRKISGIPVSDIPNSQESVEYTLEYYERVSFSSVLTRQEVMALGIITEQRDGIFYDLLPIGTSLDLSSISASTYTESSTSGDSRKCSYTVETITNWKNSGRTMVKIHVTAPDGAPNYDPDVSKLNTMLTSGFIVKIRLINSWQNIGDYGATVLNSSAYYSLDGELVNGFADTGGNITDKELFKDLDGDGNPPEAIKNVQYAQCTTTFSPLIAAEIGFKKSVKAADESRYSDSSQVSASGTYTYQLRFANSSNMNTSDVVLFDVLESAYGHNPYWRGTLQSINTSQPENKGIVPMIYYSTYQGFTNLTLDNSQTDLTDVALWTTVQPADLAEVTAIAIDLRHKADGSDYVFTPEEVALCYITMTAPENYMDYVDDPRTEADETVYAYNSAYLQCTSTPVYGGVGKTSTEECAPVTVSMRAPDVEIHKASDPQSGTAASPTVVQVGDTITYNLSITNKGKAEAIYSARLEDVIPDGLSIHQSEIKYYFGDTATNPALLNSSTRITLSSEGQKLVFTVDKLDGGETLHLLIPVSVLEDGVVFENTAKLTDFNGKTWNEESETTWHTTAGGYELPNTGGVGVLPFYFSGAALTITSMLGWKNRRRRKKINP